MAINSEIQPRRPRNDLVLGILSKFALALALEGLQTAPRASVFLGPVSVLLGPDLKKHSAQMVINSGGWLSSPKPPRGGVLFWSESVFGPDQRNIFIYIYHQNSQ